MKSTKTYHLLILSAFLVQLIVSCGTNEKVGLATLQTARKTININFHDNVLELHPLKVTSQSEIFITELVFDRFYDASGSSSLIKRYFYDSINSYHVFKLLRDKKFHDGTPVNTQAIKTFFNYLIKYHFDKEPIKLFFSSMEGFQRINWYREQRGILDSIPNGFQIINDSTFHIKIRKNSHDPKELMSSSEFTLFKQVGDQYIGSGSYELKNLKEDISAKLEKAENATAHIETINISFIKNNELVFAEFLNGSLDLILYQPLIIVQSEKQSKLLEDKYPQYQVVKSNRTVLRYAQFNNFRDTTLLEQVINTTSSATDSIHFVIDGQEFVRKLVWDSVGHINIRDSRVYKIPVLSGQLTNHQNYFLDSNSIKFVSTKTGNINPSGPHIVIKETMLKSINKNEKKTTTLELNKRLKSDDYSALLILEGFPEHVIFNNRLRGMEEGQSLSSMIKSMYYITPKAY